jgi:ribosomal-protein-alanine N-acetyltransferase
MILFETDNFRVRQFNKDDGEDFFQFNGNAEATRFIRPAKTREECDIFLAENIELYARHEKTYPFYGRMHVSLKSTGEYVGVFSLLFLKCPTAGNGSTTNTANNVPTATTTAIPGSAESMSETFHIGFGFLPKYWGRGYATELLKFGTAFFFKNTSYPTIFGITEPANIASEVVLKKNGFLLMNEGSLEDDDNDDDEEVVEEKLHLFRLNRADFALLVAR